MKKPRRFVCIYIYIYIYIYKDLDLDLDYVIELLPQRDKSHFVNFDIAEFY